MAVSATRCNSGSGVIHRPGAEAAGDGGIGMAYRTIRRGRNVRRRFVQYNGSDCGAHIVTVVANGTIRRNSSVVHRGIRNRKAADRGVAMA